ncbi:MAG: ubiquitin-conjugating enzyme E2 [Dehalococcoidia bacterium]|nr:ubiquitin-conjugating enzyme E2 [Dehalococcoidia bacterium]MDD5493324.1 ubiquitin-conjugating enzyme E2 [Dehalococcoidia bacterium]
MRIFIWDFTHDRYYPVLTSENTTVKNLLAQAVPQIVKERGPGRQFVAYLQKTGEQLYVKEDGHFFKSGKEGKPVTLHPWQTMSVAGVVENEVLVLCYFIQPGVVSEAVNVEQRFADEYEKLKELEASSDMIRVEAVEGNPPRKYRVTINCKGMMRNPVDNKLYLTANHVLEIDLPVGISAYPYEAPYIRCLTPHFHPNISPDNNLVCTGVERKWEPSLDLAWLVCHLADIITYRIYGTDDPYNKEAVQWAEAHKDKFPLDERSLFKEAVAVPVSQAQDTALVAITGQSVMISQGEPELTTSPKTEIAGTAIDERVSRPKAASRSKSVRKSKSTAKKSPAARTRKKKSS